MRNSLKFKDVRGFNYQPGYAATGLEIWNSKFNFDQIKREVERCKLLFPRTNLLRLWLSHDAFLCDQARMVDNFGAVVDIIGQADLRAMPCLFNNWHSVPDFGGIAEEMIKYWSHPSRSCVFTDYVEAIVQPYVSDPRILLWDLCNEPFNSGRPDVYIPWLRLLHEHCRKIGVVTITVGVPANVEALKLVEPFCDVLTPHCYFAKGLWVEDKSAFCANMDVLTEFSQSCGKPMFAGETGWGSLDDKERTDSLRIELQALIEHEMGFCIHMLNHSPVGDGHRPNCGPVSEAGFMGCIEADGSLRAGHEVISEF